MEVWARWHPHANRGVQASSVFALVTEHTGSPSHGQQSAAWLPARHVTSFQMDAASLPLSADGRDAVEVGWLSQLGFRVYRMSSSKPGWIHHPIPRHPARSLEPNTTLVILDFQRKLPLLFFKEKV